MNTLSLNLWLLTHWAFLTTECKYKSGREITDNNNRHRLCPCADKSSDKHLYLANGPLPRICLQSWKRICIDFSLYSMNMREYSSTSLICNSACQVFHKSNQAVSDLWDYFMPPHIDPAEGGNSSTYASKAIEFDEWHNARVRCWDHVGEGDAWGMWHTIVRSSTAGHMAWSEQSERLAGKFNSANCAHHKCPRGNFNNIWNKPMIQI